jgi:hypothetical protein
MRKALILIALLAVSSTTIWCQETAKTAKATKPISVLEWLVGGVWTADAAKLGPGMQRIETRYQWSDNAAYIRFTTHFVMDKGILRNYDGNFFWNAEQSSLAMWYMDAHNSITQGLMTVDGDTLQMTFRAEGFDGKPGDFRVTVSRKTNDRYKWLLEQKQPDGWKQFPTLEYFRATGSGE